MTSCCSGHLLQEKKDQPPENLDLVLAVQIWLTQAPTSGSFSPDGE
eukprot:CAMPEP_0113541124 /NCGR_PEP_ID=MMETSP0015_2-20120614/8858_1 /TAXON_ID=2838 /ORGANISM="Odontella" /LENGTH=45 /DNA_ID=CAMNT_0000440997 /DNA_START=37 /DNA_END=174 /DNA_ORIENTATION=+ /assembly_acc=CAM_ASM_000160